VVSAEPDIATHSAGTSVHDLNVHLNQILKSQVTYGALDGASMIFRLKVHSVSAARFSGRNGQKFGGGNSPASSFLRGICFTFFSNSGFVAVDYVPKVWLKKGETGHFLFTICPKICLATPQREYVTLNIDT
jgi:hypothetical protein